MAPARNLQCVELKGFFSLPPFSRANARLVGASWCNSVYYGDSTRSQERAEMSNKPQMKRFSVSLEAGEYEELCRIAQTHRPPLSLQYVVRYALQKLFDEHKDRQLQLTLNRE